MESELNVLALLEMRWFSSSTARRKSGNSAVASRARESPRLADRLSLAEDSKGIIWRKGRADAVVHESFIYQEDGNLVETPRLVHGDRNAPTSSVDSGERNTFAHQESCYSSTAVLMPRSDGSNDVEDDACYPCAVDQSKPLIHPSREQRVCVYIVRLMYKTYFSVLLGVHVLFDVMHVLKVGQHG